MHYENANIANIRANLRRFAIQNNNRGFILPEIIVTALSLKYHVTYRLSHVLYQLSHVLLYIKYHVTYRLSHVVLYRKYHVTYRQSHVTQVKRYILLRLQLTDYNSIHDSMSKTILQDYSLTYMSKVIEKEEDQRKIG